MQCKREILTNLTSMGRPIDITVVNNARRRKKRQRGSITHSPQSVRRAGKNEDAARCAAMKFRLDITQKFCSNFRREEEDGKIGAVGGEEITQGGTQCRHYGMTAFLHVQGPPCFPLTFIKSTWSLTSLQPLKMFDVWKSGIRSLQSNSQLYPVFFFWRPQSHSSLHCHPSRPSQQLGLIKATGTLYSCE